jgi:hypothetical protein
MIAPWIIKLETGKTHVTELAFYDEANAALDLTGYVLRFTVTHETGALTWSNSGGHTQILNQTTHRGKATLTVPKAEMTDALMPFEWAEFKCYLDSPTGDAELVYSGKVQRT